MYYRYEAKLNPDYFCEGASEKYYDEIGHDWVGIFRVLPPWETEKFYTLYIPRWYDDHPDVKTKAWFTEAGIRRFGSQMQKSINDGLRCRFNYGQSQAAYQIRVVTTNRLKNIIIREKYQIIQKI